MSLGDIPELEELRARRRISRLVLPYATAALLYHVTASCLMHLVQVSLLTILEPYIMAVLACMAASAVLSYVAETRAHVAAGLAADVLPLVSAGTVLLLMCPLVVAYSHVELLRSVMTFLAYITFALVPPVLTSGACMFMRDVEMRALAYAGAVAPLVGVLYMTVREFSIGMAEIVPLLYGLALAVLGQRCSRSRASSRARVAYVISVLALVTILVVLYLTYLRRLLLAYVPQLTKYVLLVDSAIIGSLVLVGGLALSSLTARGEEPLVLDEVVTRIVERFLLREEDYIAGLVSSLLRSFIVEGRKESLYMLIVRIGRSRSVPEHLLDEAVRLVESYRDIPPSGLLSAWQSVLVSRINVARRIGLVHMILKVLQGLPITDEDVKIVETDVRHMLTRCKSRLLTAGQVLAYIGCAGVALCPVLVVLYKLWTMLVPFSICAILSIHLSQYVPSPVNTIVGSARGVLKVRLLKKK